MKQKKYFFSILLYFFLSTHISNGQQFITRWNLSIFSGGFPNQITFNASTTGPVNYSWETIPAGTSGAGTFTGISVTITGLPSNGLIRLKIDSTNLKHIEIGSNHAPKLVDIEQWGSISWNSMENSYTGCTNLNISATDIPDLSQVNSTKKCFQGCSSLNSPSNINSWNVSTIANMENMFAFAASFNQPIGNWNTSSVTSMKEMFEQAIAFNQPIGNWDVSNVTDLSFMFWFASAFNQPIGNWDVSNVTNMLYLFFEAGNFNQPIGNWDVSNVISMQQMFQYATNFNQSLLNWDVSNVTTMDGMFAYASAFNQPIENWNVSNVSNMNTIFLYATAFNQSLGNWNLNSNVILTNAFSYSGINCSKYSQTLYGWGNNINCPSNRQLGAIFRQYGVNGINARNYLIISKGWNISGDLSTSGVCCFTKYHTLTTNACNSFYFNNQTLTTSGIYQDTLLTSYGCDSIITLNLTIGTSASSSNQTHTACGSYFFNNQTLLNSGTYYDTLINSTGCDSLITLNLTINSVNNTVTQSGISLTSNETGAIYQWLNCPSYSSIIGANNQIYSATINGDYAVSITKNSCIDTSNCYTVVGVGLNEINALTDILISPNPTNGIINISSQWDLYNSEINILNSIGQIILTKELKNLNTNIDISKFANSIYYIEINSGIKTYRTKLIKN